MSKPNKEGWIRHRGGKCPVDKYQLVDYRMRDSEVMTREAGALDWSHGGSAGDILSYRLHKPEQVKPKGSISMSNGSSIEFGRGEPLVSALESLLSAEQMRDRIREIDSTVEALEEERVSLVQKLEAEGFRLIDPAKAESRGGMQDWQNWELGDLVEVIDCGRWVNPVGAVIEITCLGGDDYPIKAGGIWYRPEMLKWRSRPSA